MDLTTLLDALTEIEASQEEDQALISKYGISPDKLDFVKTFKSLVEKYENSWTAFKTFIGNDQTAEILTMEALTELNAAIERHEATDTEFDTLIKPRDDGWWTLGVIRLSLIRSSNGMKDHEELKNEIGSLQLNIPREIPESGESDSAMWKFSKVEVENAKNAAEGISTKFREFAESSCKSSGAGESERSISTLAPKDALKLFLERHDPPGHIRKGNASDLSESEGDEDASEGMNNVTDLEITIGLAEGLSQSYKSLVELLEGSKTYSDDTRRTGPDGTGAGPSFSLLPKTDDQIDEEGRKIEEMTKEADDYIASQQG